jgi:histidyl-tRNA synthetase
MGRPKAKTNSSTSKKIQLLPGMSDIIPPRDANWEYVVRKLQQIAKGFGYARVEVPLIENSALYENSANEDTTVVTFMDPDMNKLAVRPEILPGILRAHNEHKVIETERISKWFYAAPITSYDERQKKFVSSWEYGFELIGELTPLMEVQLISLTWKLVQAVGLSDAILEVNSVGNSESRAEYEDLLRSYLVSKKYELCNDCVASLEEYPLQIFRCKNLECQTVASEAPQIVDALDEPSRKHFTHVLEGMDELGVPYALNPMLVGRPGSSGVVFGVKHKDEQHEYFLGEGANHAEIYRSISSKSVNTFGFSGSVEVLCHAAQNGGLDITKDHRPEVFLVPLGDLASKKSLRLFSELWDAEVVVHHHFGDNGVKNQLKHAEESKAMIALIIGQKEAIDETVILRDVKSGMQEIFQYERIIEEVKKRLGR